MFDYILIGVVVSMAKSKAKKLEHINLWDVAGVFLAVEGVASILGSSDQRAEANLSRVIRVIIGVAIAVYEK
jgi:drug/metabolite transporter (DMT)-like permease